MEKLGVRSYVIRGGRINPGRKRALCDFFGTYGIEFSRNRIDFTTLDLPGCALGRVVVEIGFGTGEATISLAHANPETLYIGIEVFPAGVGNVLREIHKQAIENIRVIRYDAAEVVTWMLPDSKIDGFHIFFPDPWPKKRHKKRRLLDGSFVKLLAEKLKPGGYLYVVTDWNDYADQVLEACKCVECLEEGFAGLSGTGYALPNGRRPATKYEKKALAQNHAVTEICFTKTRQELHK